jgi:sarcosine oxidase subunit beta
MPDLAVRHGCAVDASQAPRRLTDVAVQGDRIVELGTRLYKFSLRLNEGLSNSLNFNIMLSQRGVLTLDHSRDDLDAQSRWANAMRCNGIDAELLDAR